MQSVVSFLVQLMSRSNTRTFSEEMLRNIRSHCTELQQAFLAFQSRGSTPGDTVLSNNLGKLDRCASLSCPTTTAQLESNQH